MTKDLKKIEPGVGAGPIKLGMPRGEVERAYPWPYKTYFKSSASKMRCDHCDAAGFVAYYDESANVNFIELFNDRNRSVIYEIFGIPFSDLSLKKLKGFLDANNFRYESSVYGIEAKTIGLTTFNSDIRSDDDIVESIGIYYPSDV
jgi:hypothetical protein